jgi:Flp pilus assembly pilin Flp
MVSVTTSSGFAVSSLLCGLYASRKETAMTFAASCLLDFIRDESGQDLIEYGLILAVMALALIASMTSLTNTIGNFFNNDIGNHF